jgi:hypothetical protein
MPFQRGQAKIGGRKKGTPNKRTAAVREAGDRAIAQMQEPFEGDSYAFLATVYKNQALPLGVRLDAAKTAIAYERARLAHVAMTTRSLDQLSDEEFFRAWDSMTSFLAQHGRPRLLEMTLGSLDEEPASPDAAGRDTGGRDDAG